MRTDAALEAEQKSDDYDPVASLHYWDTGTSSWVNLNPNDELMEAIRIDLPYSTQAHIDLDNSEGTLDSLDLCGKIVRMGFGSSTHYSHLPYLWAEGWGNGLTMDAQSKTIFGQGAWEKLEGWICPANYDTFAGDGEVSSPIYQKTIKEMINWVCQQANLGKLSVGGSGGLAADISTDGHIATWKPFYIFYKNQNGKQIVKGLLELTQCLLVPFEDTFRIKKIDGTEASVYSYSDIAYHYFEEAHHEKHLWKPMKVQVVGPITFVHKATDTLNTVTAGPASDKASFATLAREIKADYNLHRQNLNGSFHTGTGGSSAMTADLPHKAEGGNNMLGATATSWATLAQACYIIKYYYNTEHRASTVYHEAADSTNVISSNLHHRCYTAEPYGYFADTTNVVGSDDATDLASAITLLNEMKADYNAHIFTAHHADIGPVVGSDDATELASAIALASELKADYNSHRSSTYHWTADSGNEVTTSDPTDEASLVSLANELKADYNSHIDFPQGEILAMINECKADYNAHRVQSGVHVTNDTWHVVDAADATDLSSGCTLAEEIKADYNLHKTHTETQIVAMANHEKAVLNGHFIADNTHSIDDPNVVDAADATDLASAYTLINDIKAHYSAHLYAQNEHTGTYTHTDWTSDMGYYVWRDIFGLVTSDAIALAMATAIVLRAELESEKGKIVTLGINALQEMFDVVSIAGDVAGVLATDRIGGLRWFWQPLDGNCYMDVRLGGVQYTLPGNDNWMAEDLELLQEQSAQQAVATVPVAPSTVTVIDQQIASGATVSVDYPVQRGYLYMAKVGFKNDTDSNDGFSIEATPYDSTNTAVGGTKAAKCAGGEEQRSFPFYSGNLSGTTTPFVRVKITNNTGAAKDFSATIMLIQLM